MSPWFYVSLAIAFEIAATMTLKKSATADGHVLLYSISMVLYAISFYFVEISFRDLEAGVVYAVWSACGTAIVAILGVWLFHESLTLYKVFFLIMIVVGVAGLYLSSQPANPTPHLQARSSSTV